MYVPGIKENKTLTPKFSDAEAKREQKLAGNLPMQHVQPKFSGFQAQNCRCNRI